MLNRILSQVENLTRKAQLQEVELERTSKQLKEAISIATEEAARCNAAKEVIKSLTAQVRWFLMTTSCFPFYDYINNYYSLVGYVVLVHWRLSNDCLKHLVNFNLYPKFILMPGICCTIVLS